MKQIVVPVILFCIAFACACVLLLQPLQLVKDGSTRLTVHVGKTVPLVGIAELAGGYRCYVSEDEYFWVSSEECQQATGDKLEVEFKLSGPITIYRGET